MTATRTVEMNVGMPGDEKATAPDAPPTTAPPPAAAPAPPPKA